MRDLLEALLWSPGFLLGVAGLILCVLVLVLLRSLNRARDAASYTPLAEGEGADLDYQVGDTAVEGRDRLRFLDLRGPPQRADLQRVFHHVGELTEDGETGRLPWFLCLGAAGAGKSTLLGHSDLRLPLGEPSRGAPGEKPPACDVWIFDRAVVLDIAGDLVLPETGVSADRASWTGLLLALAAERPLRPADGIILTLGTSELLAAESGDPTALRLLGRRADRLRRRLEEAQQTLGFELPVSVILTKADLIPGFPDLQNTLPEPARRQIFGWSNPYPPATAYAGSWPDDAVESLRGVLLNQQARVLAAGLPLTDPQAYLALPATFAALLDPLRTYLNRIFAGGPGATIPPLRGVYLTAGEGFPGPHRRAPEAANADTTESGDAHRQIDFVADLLPEKVFSDWDLARPVPELLAKQEHRRTLARVLVAVLIVVGPLMLMANALYHRSQVNTLRDGFIVPAIRAVDDCAARATRATGPPPSDPTGAPADCLPQTITLLRSAAVVPDYRLRPASIVGDLTECVSQLATASYERVVFPTLHRALDQAGDRIATTPVPAQTGVVYGLPSVNAFVALRSMMASLDRLETHAGYYNRFVGTDTCWSSAQDTVRYFNDLTSDLVGQSFTPPTGDARNFYGQILCDAHPEPYDPLTSVNAMDTRVEELSATMFRDLYTRNAITVDLERLETAIQGLATNPPAPAQAEEVYRDLVQLIDRTQEDLADPRLAWAAQDTPRFGSSYETLLHAVTASRWTGLDTAREIQRQASRGLADMRQALADASTTATGPLLARDGTVVLLRLAPNVLSLRAALATLLGQYLRPVGDLGWTIIPASGTFLSWDPVQLSAAADLLDAYDAFVTTQFDTFPTLRPAFDQSTRDRVEREALSLAARGQRYPPLPTLTGTRQIETQLAEQVSNLQAAGEPLNRLLTDFRKPTTATACTPSSELPYCLTVQALGVQQVNLLDLLDQLLAARALYTPQADAFADWSGTGNLAWNVFDVADAKGLAAFVDSQRAVVTDLDTQYAGPILTTVPVPASIFPATPEPLERWDLLRSDLAAYEAKAPGNPLSRLEGFILDDMAGATLASCEGIDPYATTCLPASAQGRVQPPPCDYFLASRNRLLLASAARCESVTLAAGSAAWRTLADSFDRQLAGRYPFVAAKNSAATSGSGATTGALNPTDTANASPTALADFFATYDSVKPAVERSLQVNAELHQRDPASLPTPTGVQWPAPTWSAANAAEVSTFFTRMDDVRTFFTPFLTAWAAAGDKPKPLPSFGLEVDLRPAPASEAGGSQILRRTLSLNGTPVRAEGPPPPTPGTDPITWTFGSSLSLALEWAQDGWYRPVSVAASPYGRVAGTRVTYDYPGPWSLLRLLRGVESCPVVAAAATNKATTDKSTTGESTTDKTPAFRPAPTVTDLRAFCVETRREEPPTPEPPTQRWFKPQTPAAGSAPEAPTRVELFVRAVPQTADDPRVTLALPTFPAAAPKVPAIPGSQDDPAVQATDTPSRTAALAACPPDLPACVAGGR